MAKADVDVSTISFEQVAELIEVTYGLGTAVQDGFKKLYGGFSGSNYAVRTAAGMAFCIKVCNGYSRAEVEEQARLMHHIRATGYTAACVTLPLASKDGPFEFAAAGPGLPAATVCLSFVDGVPADQAIASTNPALPLGPVIFAVGALLAGLHKVPLPSTGRPLRTFEAGGACLVAEHMRGEMLAKMEGSEHAVQHPFYQFYERQLAELRAAMADAERLGLPIGVLHGDPFLDNCLVCPGPGGGVEAALVDFEDVAVGPLLFDFACCVIGSCFRPSPENTFDFARFDSLASGYRTCRTLSADEVGLFIRFLRLTLLCNCAWRFANFNIDYREIEGCRDAYVELQDRIEALSQPALVEKIETVLQSANGVEPT